MGLILFLLRSSWHLLAIASVTGFLSGISSTAIIALSNRTLHQWGSHQPLSLMLVFSGVAAIALVAGMSSQLILIRLAQQAIFQLRLQLSRQILAAELAHLEQAGSARLLASLTDDIQAVATAVWLIPFLCIDMAMVLGGLAYILWLSWQVFLLVCALITTFLAAYRQILRQAKRELRLGREQQDILFRHFRALTDGAKELKLHAERRRSFLDQDLTSTIATYRRYQVAGLSWFVLIDNFGKFAFLLVVGLLLFALPHGIAIDATTLSGYLLTFIYLMKPMESLIARLPSLSQASVSLQKIESLNLALRDRAESLPQAAPVNPHWHTLELQGVTHTYWGDRDDGCFTLGPIDLTFHPGELVFIIGGNGSGKSTLGKLITGLYRPEQGKICLDGEMITSANCEWYRQHFSAIFSDFYLFDRLLGLDADRLAPQIQHYLRQLQLEQKVTILAGHLSNTALSQGQRKRLALLTALLEDRPIYLFDEWAADQDPGFREIFYTQFLPALRDRGKTILVITHDDHYFHLADRWIKLEYGQVEQQSSSSPPCEGDGPPGAVEP
jgi:putative ATP-binding cassette transporter